MANTLNDALDDLEKNSEPQELPKKKVALFSGFTALSSEGRKRLIYLSLFIVCSFLFLFRNLIFQDQTQQTAVIEETTGDQLVGAAIDANGTTVAVNNDQSDIEAQVAASNKDRVDYADAKGYSDVEDVRFAHWFKQEEEPEAPINPALPGSNQGNMASQEAYGQQQYSRAVDVEAAVAFFNAQLQKTSLAVATPNPIPTEQQPQQPQSQMGNYQAQSQGLRGSSSQALQAAALASQLLSEDDRAGTQAPPGIRHLLPGDVVICQVVKAINSDVSRQTNCIIRGSNLDGGRITLNIKREKDYVYLEGTNLVFGDNFVQLKGAIAVDTGDVAANGIRDDVDYHSLKRWSALMLAGGSQAVTDLVGQPRMRQTNTATESTWETIEASDSDIIKAALARPAALANNQLMEVFNTPPTVYLDKDRIIHIYFTDQVTAPWMPDMRLKNTNNFKMRDFK